MTPMQVKRSAVLKERCLPGGRAGPKAVAERKTCRACGESKAAEDFCLDSRATDGLQSRCRQCFTQYFTLWAAQRRLAKRPDVARHKVCAMCGLDKLAEVLLSLCFTSSRVCMIDGDLAAA